MRQNGATSLLMLTIAGFWYQMAGGRCLFSQQQSKSKRIFFFKFFVVLEICRYFAQILKSTMNQQEIRSKYYLHSDVFHPESTTFFFFLQKRYFSSLVMR